MDRTRRLTTALQAQPPTHHLVRKANRKPPTQFTHEAPGMSPLAQAGTAFDGSPWVTSLAATGLGKPHTCRGIRKPTRARLSARGYGSAGGMSCDVGIAGKAREEIGGAHPRCQFVQPPQAPSFAKQFTAASKGRSRSVLPTLQKKFVQLAVQN